MNVSDKGGGYGLGPPGAVFSQPRSVADTPGYFKPDIPVSGFSTAALLTPGAGYLDPWVNEHIRKHCSGAFCFFRSRGAAALMALMLP
jgi:hypothetical protein